MLTSLESYMRSNNNILLSSHPPTYILLYTNSLLMIPFPNLSPNVYLIFSVKLVIIAKKTRLNIKQIKITCRLAYTK